MFSCKGKHSIFKCSVFKEKTPTQRAKFCAENKLFFCCFQGKHMFRKCISPELARRLNLTGRKIDLTVNGANCSEDITSEQVDLNVSSEFDPDISFTVCAYVKNNIYIGSDIINVRRLQEKNSHLEPIDSVEFRYADVEMILGQDVNEYICHLEYCQDKSQKSPFAVRLLIGWVLSGPSLPPPA